MALSIWPQPHLTSQILPLNFSQDEPGGQLVDARWKLTFDNYLSSAKDFVIALVDVSGSGGNGDAFKHAIFRQIGVLETKDSYHVLK